MKTTAARVLKLFASVLFGAVLATSSLVACSLSLRFIQTLDPNAAIIVAFLVAGGLMGGFAYVSFSNLNNES